MAFNPRRFTRNAVIIAAAIGLGTAWTIEGIVPNLSPKNFAEVKPGVLYRSGILTTSALEKVVNEHNIQLVIDLGGQEQGTDGNRREDRAVSVLGVDRILLPLFGDGTGDPNQYVRALQRIRQADGPVLVHCHAGAQRTGVAIALYRIYDEGWTMDAALAEAERYGQNPDTNPRFDEYLKRWAASIEESARSGIPIPYDGPTAVAPPGD